MSLLRDLFLGFIKLHILYHAGQEPIYGVWMMEELAAHGYQLSAGTLYPMLHWLEEEGYLSSEQVVVEGKRRKYYSLTPEGREVLQKGKDKAVELLNEIQEREA
ncbi:MAG: PadR family transcriptional regulator [Anaerolineales bacterium]